MPWYKSLQVDDHVTTRSGLTGIVVGFDESPAGYMFHVLFDHNDAVEWVPGTDLIGA